MSPDNPRVGSRPAQFSGGYGAMPDYTAPKADNGRVPVLQEQYRQLLENDKEIKALLLTACQRWDADHDRLIVLEAKVQRNTERIGIWQAGQAIWTTVAATLAGWFGTRS